MSGGFKANHETRFVVEGGFWAAAAITVSELSHSRSDGISDVPTWMTEARLPTGARLLPMIKLIVLIPRRADLTAATFHQYWLLEHATLARSVADDVALQRYVQSHEVPSSVSAGFAEGRGWSPNIFEGVTEGWWNSEGEMIEAFSSPAGEQANALLIEDERRFCDQRTVAMITREYLIYDRNQPAC